MGHSTEKSTSQVRPPSSVGPSATSTSITMIKFSIVAALVVVVAGRTIEETKVNDKVAAEKSNPGIDNSTPATRSKNAYKKKPYGIRDDYDDAEYGHDYVDSASTYGYQVKDDYSYNIQDKFEETDDNGVVHGYYSVYLPDGRHQKVTYTVDHYSGYLPVVEYEGVAKYPAATYDEEYDGAYKGSYKGSYMDDYEGGYKSDYKDYQSGGNNGYQPSKQTYKKPYM